MPRSTKPAPPRDRRGLSRSSRWNWFAVRALDLNQRLALFTRICDAVHYAHQQGVIHRDLKPANILVDDSGQPKILDFGVARLTDVDVQATRQTSVGEVIGTLQYMSPEQVNADPLDIDVRSDVYTLDVILFELLTGQLPYDLSRRMIHQAAKIILADEPIRMSTISRRLAGDVDIIVAKTLEKEKTRRYGSADELASDVRRFLRDEPILARRASAVYQLRKFARRNRALVGGLLLAAGILIVGSVVSVWQAVRATAAERLAESRRGEAVAASQLAERRRAVADSALAVADSARAAALREQAAALASAKEAVGETAKARAINGFLQQMLASSDPANAQGKELSVRELLDQAATGSGTSQLTQQPEVGASVETTIGRTYFGLGLYDKARPHLDSAYAVRRRTQRGNFAEAERLYRQAIRLTRSRHPNGGLEVAEKLSALGQFLSYIGRAAEATPLLEESLAIVRRSFGPIHPRVVDALIGLTDAHIYRPDAAGAEKTAREALPIAKTLYGPAHPVVANGVSRLASALTFQRRAEEAEPLHREALAIRIQTLGADHPDVQLSRVELARLLQGRERFAEADTLLRAALQARRTTYGDTSPAIASSLMDLAMLENARQDWASAVEWFRQSVPIWRAAGIEDQELYALGEMARSLERLGKLDEADTVLKDVLTRRKARLGESHWAVGATYDVMANVAVARGRLVEAESLAVMGLAIRKRVYGPRSALSADGFVVEARGDTARAIPLFREAVANLTALRPPSDHGLVANQRWLAIDLCATGSTAEGDSLIRRAIAETPADSNSASRYRLQSSLGFCLTRQRRFAEAEPLLLDAVKGLEALRLISIGPNPEERQSQEGHMTVKDLERLYDYAY